MGWLYHFALRFRDDLNRDDRGAALVEWAFLVVLIAILALVGVAAAGNELSETYGGIATTLQDLNG